MNANCITTDAVCVSQLTPRDLQVLELVAEGMSNKEVGAALGMSARTVKQHLRYSRMRLGFPCGHVNRIQLVNRLHPPTGVLQMPERIKLTPREEELLYAFVEGQHYSEIAAKWGTSVQSAKNLARSLFDKTGMSSKSEVVAWYRAHCVPAQ